MKSRNISKSIFLAVIIRDQEAEVPSEKLCVKGKCSCLIHIEQLKLFFCLAILLQVVIADAPVGGATK